MTTKSSSPARPAGSCAKVVAYPDAGHGGIFQYHAEFVPEALEFLDA
jgi:hypothetical protein